MSDLQFAGLVCGAVLAMVIVFDAEFAEQVTLKFTKFAIDVSSDATVPGDVAPPNSAYVNGDANPGDVINPRPCAVELAPAAELVRRMTSPSNPRHRSIRWALPGAENPPVSWRPGD